MNIEKTKEDIAPHNFPGKKEKLSDVPVNTHQKLDTELSVPSAEEEMTRILRMPERNIKIEDLSPLPSDYPPGLEVKQSHCFVAKSDIPVIGGYAGPCRILFVYDRKNKLNLVMHLSRLESLDSVINSLRQSELDFEASDFFMQEGTDGLSSKDANGHIIKSATGVDEFVFNAIEPFNGQRNLRILPQMKRDGSNLVSLYKGKFFSIPRGSKHPFSECGNELAIAINLIQDHPVSSYIVAYYKGTMTDKASAIETLSQKIPHTSTKETIRDIERFIELFLIKNDAKNNEITRGDVTNYLYRSIKNTNDPLTPDELSNMIDGTDYFDKDHLTTLSKIFDRFNDKLSSLL